MMENSDHKLTFKCMMCFWMHFLCMQDWNSFEFYRWVILIIICFVEIPSQDNSFVFKQNFMEMIFKIYYKNDFQFLIHLIINTFLFLRQEL